MQGFLQTMYIQKKLNLEKKEQKSKLQCKEAKCSLLENYTEFCTITLLPM